MLNFDYHIDGCDGTSGRKMINFSITVSDIKKARVGMAHLAEMGNVYYE
ncbi:MAG: hypothetical protein NC347_06680 [Clostridium sp.]|nr:hypothetical protein [Clostridium sp.]